jgi:hypothetical protein
MFVDAETTGAIYSGGVPEHGEGDDGHRHDACANHHYRKPAIPHRPRGIEASPSALFLERTQSRTPITRMVNICCIRTRAAPTSIRAEAVIVLLKLAT